MSISYKQDKDQVKIAVFLGAKRVGTIFPINDGFMYAPKGRPDLAGDIYPSVADVKKSLEEE